MLPQAIPTSSVFALLGSPQGIYTIVIATATILILSVTFLSLVAGLVLLPTGIARKNYRTIERLFAIFFFGLLASVVLMVMHLVGSAAIRYADCPDDVPKCYDSY